MESGLFEKNTFFPPDPLDSTVVSKKNTHKATHPLPEAWYHQIHAAGGASGSITMVMVMML